MLKKENRLQKEKDFQRVFKGSRPIYAENLVFRVVKQYAVSSMQLAGNAANRKPQTANFSRFGFVISNKISKLATRRNALKRQLRAIIENEMTDIKTGYDIIIMVKSDFNYPYKQEEIREQVEKGLKIAGL